MNISEELFETALANSYKNFHAKGFDYLCLKRTPELTEKVYFFRGQSDTLHDVVNPHDHRYDFRTQCLAGEVANHTWAVNYYGAGGTAGRFHRFDYDTPLNGGAGFTASGGEVGLNKGVSKRYSRGASYFLSHDTIHTISVQRDTVIKLWQFEDVVPVGQSTRTFTKSPDSLTLDSGLYERFTPDELLTRFRWLNELSPGGSE